MLIYEISIYDRCEILAYGQCEIFVSDECESYCLLRKSVYSVDCQLMKMKEKFTIHNSQFIIHNGGKKASKFGSFFSI